MSGEYVDYDAIAIIEEAFDSEQDDMEMVESEEYTETGYGSEYENNIGE
jgi:hypothetical protein